MGEALFRAHFAEGRNLADPEVLAAAGVASRRVSEDLIAEGRVEVDGVVVTEPGVRVDPATAVIRVDGISVQTDVTKQYFVFNKPRGVISTMVDPEGRPSIATYLKPGQEHLFHVGRLDNETEGLLILTNDGDLAHRLQHPAHGVLKTYIAEIPGPVPKDLGKTLRAGVELDDGPVQVDSFRIVDSKPGKAIVEVILHEGRKHIVRRLLEHVGHPVISLVRTQVGPITLGSTKSGRWRPLSQREISDLYKAAGL